MYSKRFLGMMAVLVVSTVCNSGISQVTSSLNLVSGRLTITGDDGSNNVALEGLPTGIAGRVQVVDFGGSIQTFFGVNSIRVNLKDGDDSLSIEGIHLGDDVRVKMGAGADVFTMNTAVSVGDILLPRDVLIGDRVLVAMGGDSGDLIRIGSNGNSTFSIGADLEMTGVADIEIEGNGATFATEPGDINVGGDMTIDLNGFGDATGSGDNLELDIKDLNVAGTTEINGSNFVDRVQITDSTFVRRVSINFKGGNDRLDIDNGANRANLFDNLLEVNGGTGTDKVREQFNIFDVFEPIFNSVEIILP